MAMMPLTTGVIKALGSGMDDGSKYVVLQSLLLMKRTVGTTGLAACPDVRPAFSGLYVGAETHL